MKHVSLIALTLAFALNGSANAAETEKPWWNPAWSQRQTITLDTTAAAVTSAIGGATVLVRLHDGNFQFASAAQDGSDLRFIAADGKTVLAHEVESYDGLLSEAFVWVKLPEVQPAAQQTFDLYYGNQAPEASSAKSTDAWDTDTTLIYHFAGLGTPPADATANANNAETPATRSDVSIIGGGLRLLGTTPINIPNTPTLAWNAGQPLTLTAWIKPSALQDNAILLSRGEGANAFQIILNQGIPLIKNGSQTSQPAAPIAPAVWSHLALVADGTKIDLFLNGAPYASLPGPLPALDAPIILGAPENGYIGEMDELSLSKIARSNGWLQLAATSQGSTDAASRTLSLGQVEGGEIKTSGGMMEHLSLFGDIAKNMMFDGWIAIGVCVVMIIVGWWVAVKKFLYLNSIEKGTQQFLEKWKALSTDLTALDPENKSSVDSLGGNISAGQESLIHKSPLYHIYHIGAEEIRHRLDKDNNRVEGLSGRSIQAIRASLDAGLVHENHRLTDGLVYLTISIAGGPYVGLLGTVVGVMITFAIIAKSGEVNVNSIAPGIASALLATVVGLVVAIPALFIYSYLNVRIKNSLALMQVFIDEFVAKMAEFYRPAQEKNSTSER
jgi:biopolymer transport protein ExbB